MQSIVAVEPGIIIALIGGIPLTITAIAGLITTIVRSGRRQKLAADQLAVSNGQKPGFMIEKTYELAHDTHRTVTELDKKFDLHNADNIRHNTPE